MATTPPSRAPSPAPTTGRLGAEMIERLRHAAAQHATPVLGITGTGGSGKSSLTDELVRRLRLDQQDKLRVAVLAVDPTRRKGGGALLGDRIRMNALDGDRVYFRSLATRGARELPEHLDDVLTILKAAGFDLVVVETPGIGQGDAAIVPFADTSLYVMTPEFGAASQLEKIDMLDFADVVAINKFERRGAKDALRDVGRQLVRNREAFGSQPDQMPVFGTSAATFNDDGVTALYQELRGLLAGHGLAVADGVLPRVEVRHSSGIRAVVPTDRVRYLAEITETVRGYHAETDRLAAAARRLQQVEAVTEALGEGDQGDVPQLLEKCHREVPPELRGQIVAWPDVVASYSGDEQVVAVRDREVVTTLTRESLSGTRIPRVALPALADHGDLVRYWRRENLPGRFPFTAGVFAFKRDGEDPARMFAGEGDPGRTNRRFKVLSADGEAKRLSTAFDSVTLYGRDPDPRPDIYGKVGTSGVSVATLDDMKTLYDGFDLLSPTTSVSMTINGPAPTVLAFFLDTVLDQAAEQGIDAATALATVRGTVQADILKEDQGQNTCLFSTEFSLRMMADIQEWFIENRVRNFYSVSISGYHIAEAGANPISQLAFTLANGFTYVEAYLARGMDIDDFAPNLSFFFSNGMDPEYSVIGRVARRIWAVAMREKRPPRSITSARSTTPSKTPRTGATRFGIQEPLPERYDRKQHTINDDELAEFVAKLMEALHDLVPETSREELARRVRPARFRRVTSSPRRRSTSSPPTCTRNFRRRPTPAAPGSLPANIASPTACSRWKSPRDFIRISRASPVRSCGSSVPTVATNAPRSSTTPAITSNRSPTAPRSTNCSARSCSPTAFPTGKPGSCGPRSAALAPAAGKRNHIRHSAA